jgi:hypothetical protein
MEASKLTPMHDGCVASNRCLQLSSDALFGTRLESFCRGYDGIQIAAFSMIQSENEIQLVRPTTNHLLISTVPV